MCSAFLLAQLVNQIIQNIDIKIDKCFYWTDSKIVLAWLRLEPNNLKIFEAHRVAEIQISSSIDNWHYVNTSENPADILSRGTTTDELKNSKLWWHGPSFLSKKTAVFTESTNMIDNSELPEIKTIC